MKTKQNRILDDLIQERQDFEQDLKVQKYKVETALGQVAIELLILQNLRAAMEKGKYVKLSIQDGKLVVEEPQLDRVSLLASVPPRPGSKSKVADLRSEIVNLQSENTHLKSDLSTVEHKCQELQNDLWHYQEGEPPVLRKELETLKKELELSKKVCQETKENCEKTKTEVNYGQC